MRQWIITATFLGNKIKFEMYGDNPYMPKEAYIIARKQACDIFGISKDNDLLTVSIIETFSKD